jgi:tripartite-type tricarboxylate transporter receptor subunit TctC
MLKRREALGFGLALLGGLAATRRATAQSDWPRKPIKVIVTFAPGGLTDTVARFLANRLAPVLGQPVVVDNRAGAGGAIGMDALAKSPGDGYTLAVGSISPIVLNPHVTKVPYDPLKDFVPVASVMFSPTLFLATAAFKGRTFDDLIKLSRAAPGSVSVATSGYGTLAHVTIEQINRKAGIKLMHVPYKGGSQVVTDAAGAQYDTLLAPASAIISSMIEQGKLRVLAVGAPSRLKTLPQIPTLEELGYPEANLGSLFGVFAPTGTPPDIVRRLNAETNKILREKATEDMMLAQDNVPSPATQEQFAAVIREQYDANAKLAKEVNLRVE